jgi:hypothetical protein
MTEPRPAGDHVSGEHAKAGDEKSKARDPHGAAPSKQAAKDEPTAAPTPDRHHTETASGAHAHRGRGKT